MGLTNDPGKSIETSDCRVKTVRTIKVPTTLTWFTTLTYLCFFYMLLEYRLVSKKQLMYHEHQCHVYIL